MFPLSGGGTRNFLIDADLLDYPESTATTGNRDGTMARKQGFLLSSALLLLAGCGQTAAPGSGAQADGTDGRNAPVGQSAADEWRIAESRSGMDGQVSTAVREYASPDRNTRFIAELSCRHETRKAGLTVQSFVGDPESPTEQSAFVAEVFQGMLGNLRHVPVARVRIGDGKVVDSTWMTYFEIGRYNNEIRYTDLQRLDESFPMLIEVSNGAGTFELVLDRSANVQQVLQACILAEAPASRIPDRIDESVEAGTDARQPVREASTETAATPSVSFDCRKAKTFAEKSVCSSTVLGVLDGVLSDNYRAMLAADIGEGARKSLRDTQRAWLVARKRCQDHDCLTAQYRARIDEICETPVLSGMHPACTLSDEVE